MSLSNTSSGIPSTEPTVLGAYDYPVPLLAAKYAPVECVCNLSSDFENIILPTIPLQHQHKHILVDIKHQYLRAGQIPAMPWWHLDCVEDPDATGKPENHFLWISGAGSRTEFAIGNIAYPCSRRELQTQANQLPTWFAPERWLITYGRTNVHRATPARFSGYRTLLRITETDVIIPNSVIRRA